MTRAEKASKTLEVAVKEQQLLSTNQILAGFGLIIVLAVGSQVLGSRRTGNSPQRARLS